MEKEEALRYLEELSCKDINPTQKRKLLDQLNSKFNYTNNSQQMSGQQLSCDEADQLYNRLSSYQEKKGQRLTQLKMKSIEKENEVYTFKPKINSNYTKTQKSEKNLEDRIEDILEKKQTKLQEIREEEELKKELQHQVECTFAPQINTKSKGPNGSKKRKIEDLYHWKQQKNDRIYNNMVQQKVEEKGDLTFQPQISSKSRQIQKDKMLVSTPKKVTDRLYQLAHKDKEVQGFEAADMYRQGTEGILNQKSRNLKMQNQKNDQNLAQNSNQNQNSRKQGRSKSPMGLRNQVLKRDIKKRDLSANLGRAQNQQNQQKQQKQQKTQNKENQNQHLRDPEESYDRFRQSIIKKSMQGDQGSPMNNQAHLGDQNDVCFQEDQQKLQSQVLSVLGQTNSNKNNNDVPINQVNARFNSECQKENRKPGKLSDLVKKTQDQKLKKKKQNSNQQLKEKSPQNLYEQTQMKQVSEFERAQQFFQQVQENTDNMKISLKKDKQQKSKIKTEQNRTFMEIEGVKIYLEREDCVIKELINRDSRQKIFDKFI